MSEIKYIEPQTLRHCLRMRRLFQRVTDSLADAGELSQIRADYFEDLLERISEIRRSERSNCQKTTDIYAEFR